MSLSESSKKWIFGFPDEAVGAPRTLSASNPLAWGMSFFAMWVTLRTVAEPTELQGGLSLIFISLSAVLGLSLFSPCLRELLDRGVVRSFLLPMIFFASLLCFAASWIGSLSDMKSTDLAIAVYVGFGWLVAYLIILVRSAMRIAGVIVSLLMVAIGVIYLINVTPTLSGWILILLGTILLIVSLWRPRFFAIFPWD